MKSEKLLELIGDIDDEIVAEADTVKLSNKSANVKFFKIGVLVAACLLIVVFGVFYSQNNMSDKNLAIVSDDIFNDEFELIALNSDEQGIDESTYFQLTTKETINEKFIKDNLVFNPTQEYKVKKVSDYVFNIIPSSKLSNDTVYQVKLNDNTKVYSWAFQTKKEFKVDSTIPSNNSTYVPYNSGIEIYFTLSNLDNIENYFEISPHVDGKFIYKDNCVVYAPEKLDFNTKYTVTVKSGFGIKGSDQKLKEDYVFSFITQSNPDAQVYFNSPLTNIYETNAKIISGYIRNKNANKDFTINIYKFKTVDAFADNIKAFSETGKFISDIVSNKDLVKLSTISQSPFINDSNYGGSALFELPDDLTKGYYLLEFNIENENNYHFLQINDMLIYNALFDNQVLVSASDGKTSKGIKDAEVFINDEKIGYTNEDGILVGNKKLVNDSYSSIFMKVKAKGYNDFVYAQNYYFNNYYYENMNNAQEYLRYIDTDRPVYLPTDTINVWGFARYRDDRTLNKVKIELVEGNTNLVLDSKNVELTDIGTYQTEFELENSTSEYCKINVYDNDIKISSTDITISKYTKPLYTLKGELDKNVVFSGGKINYHIKGNYFDGYPTANTEVKLYTSFYDDISYNKMDTSFVLDENGEANININTDVSSNGWRPVTINIDSYNNNAEDKTITTKNSFKVFPKHVMVEIEQNDENNPQMLDVLLHEIDLTKYDPNGIYYDSNYDNKNYRNYRELRSKPVNDKVEVKIIEKYSVKVKESEYYDFINKVNRIKYRYDIVENEVYRDYVNVVNGVGSLEIPNYNSERNYELVAIYKENDSQTIENSYVGSNSYYFDNPYYSIEANDNKSYRTNENVEISLKYSNEEVKDTENDKLILLFMRDGLLEYKVLDNTKANFNFLKEYIPNVMLGGAYINNGYMYSTFFSDVLYYDSSEKEIYIDVSTNKNNYKPGEEVSLNIDVRDENNKPCIADVNISVVDEAYFAVFEKYVNTLDSLYSKIYKSGLKGEYLSNIDITNNFGNAAEMGGGGGYYGIIREKFVDTNMFKTITTDANGKANVKFKLADNLTSWRISYQGITKDAYAGSGSKNITVSLPFYVDMLMAKEYLKEDKISVALRALGTDANKSEEVSYRLVVKDKSTGKEKEYTKSGIIGEYTNIMLENIDIGEYEIYAYANYGVNQDAIKKEFEVVDSSVYFNNTNYYKLSDNTVLDKVYSNPIITLYNESKSDFYNSLDMIKSSNGNRIDQTICSMISTKYINDYFKTNLDFNGDVFNDEIIKYQGTEGGFRLLPYSSDDVELTAKLVNLIGNDVENAKVKAYFKSILSETVYDTKISAALWGLSSYNEPILLTIYNLLENDNLQAKDKIYLSLALTELGDYKTAKIYYGELVKNYLVQSKDYCYFNNEEDTSINYELTALLSILGAKLNDYDTSDKLFKYIYHNPSKYTLSNIEQLIYIENRNIMELEEIKDLFGEATVDIDGVKTKYKLKLFEQQSFAVAKDKIKDIKFSNIKGSIACKVDALGNKDNLNRNKSNEFSLEVKYCLQDLNEKQTEYNQSDVVKVILTPKFYSNTSSGSYEITYVIPAGFRYMENGYKESNYASVNGQKLEFSVYYDKKYNDLKPIVFYMQAAQKGEYTVDYIIIKELNDVKLNYLDKSKLVIK